MPQRAWNSDAVLGSMGSTRLHGLAPLKDQTRLGDF
jgi:hypothetical protein